MKTFLRDNGLSIAFLVLFLMSLGGQIVTGHKEHNEEVVEQGGKPIELSAYLTSGHFLQSTFENWESEFLQMALFLILTMALYQRGSAESKDPDKEEDVDREPDPKKKDAQWPVKKGGIILAIYKQSLCNDFVLILLLSFVVHWYGSLKDYNEEQLLKNK